MNTAKNHFDDTPAQAALGWEHSGGTFYSSTNGYLLLVDAVIQGTGVASAVSAIRNQSTGAQMFLRNITTTGYLRAAEENGGTAVAGGAVITEHATTRFNLWGQTAESLNITIKNTPEKPWSALSQWTSVTAATPGFANGVQMSHAGGTQFTNEWAALQSAIDNCTTDTLYFPSTRNGVVRFNGAGTLRIRGSVRHIVGLGASLRPAVGQAATTLLIIFEHADRPAGQEAVVWEELQLMPASAGGYTTTVRIATPRDVVIMEMATINFLTNTAAATGTIFLEDVIGRNINLTFPQNMFTRQFNADIGDMVMAWPGGDLWCFNCKSEPIVPASAPMLPATWSGRVEILGGFNAFPAGNSSPTFPTRPGPVTFPIWQLINSTSSIDAELSVAGYATSPGGASGTFELYATETQNGVNRDLLPGGAPTTPRCRREIRSGITCRCIGARCKWRSRSTRPRHSRPGRRPPTRSCWRSPRSARLGESSCSFITRTWQGPSLPGSRMAA